MKKTHFILLSFLAYFLFAGNGCNKRVYDSLINYNSPTPIIYESLHDSVKLNKFIGADLRYSKGNYDKEDLALLRLNYSYVSTKENSFSNTSIIAFGGYYKVNGLGPKQGANYTDIDYDGRKWGTGLLGNIKLGLNFKFDDFKLGSGIDFLAGLETGEFLDFRNSAKSQGVIDSDRGWASTNLNIFLFSSYRFQNSSIFNLQLNVGYPGGISPILSYQHRDNIYWISFLGNRGNIGIMKSLETNF